MFHDVQLSSVNCALFYVVRILYTPVHAAPTIDLQLDSESNLYLRCQIFFYTSAHPSLECSLALCLTYRSMPVV